MSQNVFSVSPGVECLVGWDPPMGTFFGQVYAVNKKGERVDDEMIFRIGGIPDQVRTVDHLQEALRPYATIPKEIFQTLYEIEID